MNKQKRKGSQLERRVVKEAHQKGIDAHVQPGSGMYKDYPSDAVIGTILAECKCGYESMNKAGEKSFSFRTEWIDKVERQAKEAGYQGAVVCVRPGSSRRILAVVDFLFLIDLLKKAF
jgi:Holliday junction resolvase